VGTFFTGVKKIVASTLYEGQDWSTFEGRRNWLLGLNWPAPTQTQHLGMVYNLANLYNYPASSTNSNNAVNYTSKMFELLTTYDQLQSSEFFPLGIVRAIYQFGDRFSSAQMSKIGKDAEKFYFWYGGGTENHHLLRLSNAYLLAQKFPNGSWQPDFPNPKRSDRIDLPLGSARVNSSTMMKDVKEMLRLEGQKRYAHSFGEAASPNYLMAHLMPLLHLYEFAVDKEMKGIAHAMILHLLAHLSVNVYRGYILDPYPRFYNSLYTNGGKGPGIEDGVKNPTLLLNWLYWNQFTPDAARMTTWGDPLWALYPAISSYRPPIVLERIANLSSDNPGKAHWVKTTEPGHNGSSTSAIFDVAHRRVWRDKEFAIGSMTGYHDPSGFYLTDGSKLGIAYRSNDRLQYLQAGHPYWLADEPETPSNFAWWQGPLSPFMQVAHEKNTVIVMFNITDSDPWPTSTRKDFYLTDRSINRVRRSEHANAQRKECGIRFPITMDETSEVSNADGTKWYFLREGHTYIGIRSLTPSTTQIDNTNVWKALYATALLHGGRSQTGFVVEVGTSVQSGGKFATFETFKANLTARQPSVIWGSGSSPSLTVEYTNSENVTLKTEYDTNLVADAEGKVRMIPNVWVNGVPEVSDSWPDLDARLDATHPLVTMVDKVLTITDPVTGAVESVDWRGNFPVISSDVSTDITLIHNGCNITLKVLSCRNIVLPCETVTVTVACYDIMGRLLDRRMNIEVFSGNDILIKDLKINGVVIIKADCRDKGGRYLQTVSKKFVIMPT
jgi:hypothetical protein